MILTQIPIKNPMLQEIGKHTKQMQKDIRISNYQQQVWHSNLFKLATPEQQAKGNFKLVWDSLQQEYRPQEDEDLMNKFQPNKLDSEQQAKGDFKLAWDSLQQEYKPQEDEDLMNKFQPNNLDCATTKCEWITLLQEQQLEIKMK